MRDPNREGHPIVVGFVALIATAAVIAAVLGGGAFAASRVLGLDGSDSVARDQASSGQTLYAPAPTEDTPTSGVSLTDVPSATATATTSKPTSTPTGASKISLSAGQTEVGPMGDIDLSVIYPGGEGAVLQIQRLVDGSWQDFPLTIPINDPDLSTTFINTGQEGLNKFRVQDPATGKVSNVIRVTVS